MTEQQFYPYVLAAGLLSAAFVFVYLFFVPAPYGRHIRQGWGPTIPNRIGWILMETPAVLSILAFYLTARAPGASIVWVLLGAWQVHYIYRTYIFPFTLQDRGKRMPVAVMFSGMLFNVFNGYINGRYLAWNAEQYDSTWLTSPAFLAGIAIFAAGLFINITADRTLINLRKNRDTGYGIPHGGLYRWVSCPNYLGEIIEWSGWALMTWSPGGLVFAIWTAANLLPRAISNHRWYREQFTDYPSNRKAVIPFVW